MIRKTLFTQIKLQFPVAILAVLFFFPSLFADTLYLKNGKSVQGKIVSQTRANIRLKLANGRIKKFSKKQVSKVKFGKFLTSQDKIRIERKKREIQKKIERKRKREELKRQKIQEKKERLEEERNRKKTRRIEETRRREEQKRKKEESKRKANEPKRDPVNKLELSLGVGQIDYQHSIFDLLKGYKEAVNNINAVMDSNGGKSSFQGDTTVKTKQNLVLPSLAYQLNDWNFFVSGWTATFPSEYRIVSTKGGLSSAGTYSSSESKTTHLDIGFSYRLFSLSDVDVFMSSGYHSWRSEFEMSDFLMAQDINSSLDAIVYPRDVHYLYYAKGPSIGLRFEYKLTSDWNLQAHLSYRELSGEFEMIEETDTIDTMGGGSFNEFQNLYGALQLNGYYGAFVAKYRLTRHSHLVAKISKLQLRATTSDMNILFGSDKPNDRSVTMMIVMGKILANTVVVPKAKGFESADQISFAYEYNFDFLSK